MVDVNGCSGIEMSLIKVKTGWSHFVPSQVSFANAGPRGLFLNRSCPKLERRQNTARS